MKLNLVDPFQRKINYLRLSVTDRCDLRCFYCMKERMNFLPREDLLSLEELDLLSTSFVELGVQKIRVTGGEPLVRKNILSYFKSISRHLETGKLKELSLTTNGTQLSRFAKSLYEFGVRRINISLDSFSKTNFLKAMAP